MDIDAQLLNAQEREKRAAKSAAQAGNLREARRDSASNGAAGGSGGQTSQGGQDGQTDQQNRPRSLRETVQEAVREKKQAEGGLKDKAVSGAATPISRSTSNLLKQAWMNLIDSFGTSLIWINIHVWLGTIFGNKFFCKLGAEWVDQNIAGAQADYAKSQGKMIGVVEPMGLACCDAGCLFIIIAVASLVAMILGVISNPLEAIKGLLVGIWGAITGSK